MSELFVLSWSKNAPPYDRLFSPFMVGCKANGKLIFHEAESIAERACYWNSSLQTIF